MVQPFPTQSPPLQKFGLFSENCLLVKRIKKWLKVRWWEVLKSCGTKDSDFSFMATIFYEPCASSKCFQNVWVLFSRRGKVVAVTYFPRPIFDLRGQKWPFSDKGPNIWRRGAEKLKVLNFFYVLQSLFVTHPMCI